MHLQTTQKSLNAAQRLIIATIKLYRITLSPWFGQQCRFYPSCSHYAQDAIQQYGALKGMGLTIWRILRCQPLSQGGYDPIKTSKPTQN